MTTSSGRNRTKREGVLENVIDAMKRVLERLKADNDRLRRGGFHIDEDQKKVVVAYDYEKRATVEKKRADKLEGQLRDLQGKLQDAEDSNRKLLQRQNQVATLRTQLRTKDEELKKMNEEWILLKEDRDRLRGQLQVLENKATDLGPVGASTAPVSLYIGGGGSHTSSEHHRHHRRHQHSPTTPSRSHSNNNNNNVSHHFGHDQLDSSRLSVQPVADGGELTALRKENDELTALLREATDTLAMQQAQLKLITNSTQYNSEAVSNFPPLVTNSISTTTQEEITRLQDENKRLRSELSAFDLQFFEEIENLKYSYSEAVKKIKIYEKLYGQK